jgi:SAM-dependent methyltransferase
MDNMWDDKFNKPSYFYGTKPNDFLSLCSPHIRPQARILSLGEGEGRNALHLLEKGHHVSCIDGSKVAKEKCLKLCSGYQNQLSYEVVDLSHYRPTDTFDAIISIWCHLPSKLTKDMFQLASTYLKPGGLFILEAYTPRQLDYGTGGPKDLDMLCDVSTIGSMLFDLKPLILQETTRYIEEGEGHNGQSATVQLLAMK